MRLNSPQINIITKACMKASKPLIRDFGEIENLQVAKKGPKDFVTKTDKRVEEILMEELTRAKKNYSFLKLNFYLVSFHNVDRLMSSL